MLWAAVKHILTNSDWHPLQNDWNWTIVLCCHVFWTFYILTSSVVVCPWNSSCLEWTLYLLVVLLLHRWGDWLAETLPYVSCRWILFSTRRDKNRLMGRILIGNIVKMTSVIFLLVVHHQVSTSSRKGACGRGYMISTGKAGLTIYQILLQSAYYVKQKHWEDKKIGCGTRLNHGHLSIY